MPRNKVLEKAKVTPPSGRNAFDLSQIRSYSALAGELGICYAQPMIAGTKGKISRKCFTRTAAVVSPAFHDVTEHFDFFCVPIHSLWRYWENWKVNINDMQDTYLVPYNGLNNAPNLMLPGSVPHTDFDGLVQRAFGAATTNFGTEALAAEYCRKCNDALNLIDQLNYDEVIAKEKDNQPRALNMFLLAAYQKCYYDHYRNTAYEPNNPYAYNLDWLTDRTPAHTQGLLEPDEDINPGSGYVQDVYVAQKLLEVHRVNYRNDYFHNLYPAMNYVVSVNNSPSGSWSLPSNIGGASTTIVNVNNQPRISRTLSSAQLSPSILSDDLSTGYSVSVQQIRAAFALDKLMRASAYAPKHVRDQYKALYGVDGVEDFDMKSERICSFQSVVNFQEVTNMAESVNFELGSLGAKGLGGDSQSKSVSFYCKYDSIIIGLHYFVPRARYDSIGLHPFNLKLTRESFYQKAFENLGLRPFYITYLRGHQANTAIILGWSVPNFEYKILPDLNTGAFKRSFSTFAVINPSAGVYNGTVAQVYNSELSTYVPHNDAIINWSNTAVTAEYFKVRPEDLDNMFKVKVPATHNRNFCQFFGQFRISVPIVSGMSVHGQPML